MILSGGACPAFWAGQSHPPGPLVYRMYSMILSGVACPAIWAGQPHPPGHIVYRMYSMVLSGGACPAVWAGQSHPPRPEDQPKAQENSARSRQVHDIL